MLKKESDKIKKESAAAKQLKEQLAFIDEIKQASQFAEVSCNDVETSWNTFDLIALSVFLFVILLFFV